MHQAPACPPDEYLRTIAIARIVLPPEVHLQAPPNLSDDFGVLLDAGIDDWGGVSPVTADHVNPERPWPALDRLAEVTEAAGHVLAPRLTVYPAYVLDPERWIDPALRFAVLDRSDAEGLARENDRGWYSGSPVEPPPSCSPLRLAPGGAVGRGARRGRGRPGGRRSTRSSPCSRPGAPRSPPWPRCADGCATRPSATSSPGSATATSTTRTSARSSAASAASPRVRCR